jgi:alpha-D-ribose 1-methylphosphonate 5-triphosphate synthase subunit PhnH
MIDAPVPSLADLGPGFADPVGDAQRVFRTLLQAMSWPGSVWRLPIDVLPVLGAPRIRPTSAALLLALLDADTRLHLGGRLDDVSATRYLGFHTGTRIARVQDADFALFDAAEADERLWSALRDGSDLAPQSGATLIVQVPRLGEGACTLRLHGPGIRGLRRLAVEGLSAAFWQGRIAREADFPRGIELVLVGAEGDIAALTRSTRIALEG